MNDTMKVLKPTTNILILLSIALLVSILWTGGFKIQVLGGSISCYGLTNPLAALAVLLLFRLFLSIGGKNSLTFIGAIFFAAILAEMALRILNSQMALPALKNISRPSDVLGYRLVPLLKDRNIQTNSHGLRDRERGWIKPPGVKRVLGIGDSFTFGYNVSLEDCYLKQLERLLNSDNKEWDVINAGVSGYNMWQYLAYFEHYGYRYNPDLISMGVFFDDFYGDPSHEDERSDTQRYRSFGSIRLINFCRNCLDLLKYRYRYLLNAGWLKSIEERREFILNSKNYLLLSGKADPEIYQKFECRLKDLVQIAREHGARVLVLLIPDIIQLNRPELQALNHILENICRRCNADYLDVTPSFERTKQIERLYLLPHDAHTSPKGHEIIAREMEKKIRIIAIETKHLG